ncbi:Endonuclease involved in recombination [Bifidobacterium actinocoloniiforme DSM 22766]|uniref:Putative pre-16S rRNA nuclease n=2 Tax=Bifidobacterium actinocoloniiforme TaxID=638619 RepID=A0A086Z078_9BIFI|nr:Endonuclease involved in recombination [Bifidobacterium actinocoloniiforme DSM 22766]
MGVDLGEARVGLALSDPELTLAHPAGNIEVAGDYFQALDEVIAQVEEAQATRLIIGYPLLLSGQEGRSAKKAKRWVHALQGRMDEYASSGQLAVEPPELVLRDERLTTVSAHRQLSQAGLDGRLHRPKVDQQSAVVLLQAALDEHAEATRSDIG